MKKLIMVVTVSFAGAFTALPSLADELSPYGSAKFRSYGDIDSVK